MNGTVALDSSQKKGGAKGEPLASQDRETSPDFATKLFMVSCLVCEIKKCSCRCCQPPLWRVGGRVAKASLLPGVLPAPPTPPLAVFLKIAFKNDALACISEHFCILKISNLEKNEFSLKSPYCWRFGDLAGVKKSLKNQGNSPKNHGSRKAVFRDGFWSIFVPFFYYFQGAKHCKIECC